MQFSWTDVNENGEYDEGDIFILGTLGEDDERKNQHLGLAVVPMTWYNIEKGTVVNWIGIENKG